MKYSLLSIIVIPVFLIFSCKKQEDPQQHTIIGATPLTYYPISTSTATVFSGIMVSVSYTSAFGASSLVSADHSAHFFDSPVAMTSGAVGIPVKSVYLGSDSLTYIEAGSAHYYGSLAASQSTVQPNQSTWTINGNDVIPSFKYDESILTPICDNFDVFPDSISLSKGATFTINNIHNCNVLRLIFYTNNSAGYDTAIIVRSGKVTITTGNLSRLQARYGTAMLLLQNSQAVKVRNKDFDFIRQCLFYKNVPFKF